MVDKALRKTARSVEGQLDKILKLTKFDEDDVDDLDLSDLEDLIEAEAALAKVAIDSASQAATSVGINTSSKFFDQANDRAAAYAANRAADLITDIDESTRDMIRGMIASGIEAGESKADIIADIMDSRIFSEDRADLIASTEIANANSMGALQGYKSAEDLGINIQKQWIPDTNPCETCQENADEGPIDLDDTFPSGDDAPTAHPNCECVLVSVVDDEETEVENEDSDDASE